MVQVYLRDIKNYEFELHRAERLETGKQMMRERQFDIVMLDLSLPDSMGMETLSSFLGDFPNSAVIVFTGLADTTTGLEAVRLGAYDYLVKGEMNPSVLSKSILYASVKKSNEGLAKATQLAEETARMKERFLAHMSHELRTPLNVVIGMSQLLRNEIDQTKRNEYLDSLSKSARDLLQLINNVLDFSKIESGKMVVEKRHFHLGQMLKDLITVFKFKAEEKGLKLIGDFSLGDKQIVIGDSFRLKQVITNLLQNAITYTPEGSVSLIVKEEDGQIHFKIQDTGIGISKEQIEKIFASFAQATEQIARRFGGTGLGLTISREIVNLLGGELDVSSMEGLGTLFHFKLPFEKGDRFKIDDDSFVNREEGFKKVHAHGRILITDDHQLNRIVVKEMLNKRYKGLEIDVAENGLEAIEQFAEKKHDLILMDISMPKMDGKTATNKIRTEFDSELADVPIIIMTAHFQEKERQTSFDMGASGFLRKPVEQGLLYKEIERFIEVEEYFSDAEVPSVETPKEAPIAKTEVEAASNQSQGIKIDLAYIDHLSHGDTSLKQDIINSLLEDLPDELEELEKAYRLRDALAFRGCAHKMKTSLAYMGLRDVPELYKVVRKVEGNDFPFDEPDFVYFIKSAKEALKLLSLELV